MRNFSLRWLVVVVGLGALAGGGAARADDEANRKRRDHDVARKALTKGEIRPLEDVIAEVRRTVGGDIVGVELEKHGGRWIYEIKVITPPGRMRKVEVDASRQPVAPPPGSPPTAVGAAPPPEAGPMVPATTPPVVAPTDPAGRAPAGGGTR